MWILSHELEISSIRWVTLWYFSVTLKSHMEATKYYLLDFARKEAGVSSFLVLRPKYGRCLFGQRAPFWTLWYCFLSKFRGGKGGGSLSVSLKTLVDLIASISWMYQMKSFADLTPSWTSWSIWRIAAQLQRNLGWKGTLPTWIWPQNRNGDIQKIRWWGEIGWILVIYPSRRSKWIPNRKNNCNTTKSHQTWSK